MKRSRIIGVHTANPPLRLTQQEALQEVLKYHHVGPQAQEKYRQFFGDPAIRSRYLGVDNVKDVFEEHYDRTIDRFARVATAIGSEAASGVLAEAGLDGRAIDAMVVTTCTGYLCPGLSTYISQKLGLRPDVYLVDMVGQGCAAAIPALRAADYFLQSHPESRVLVVCVEICTAAFGSGEETDLLISNAIFGDGAAACLLSNQDDRPGIRLERYATMLAPQYRDELRFKTRDSRLCNVLSRNVPVITARAVNELHEQILQGACKADHYAFHTGGRAILDRIQETAGFTDFELEASRKVLGSFGNMSSPSVLFVLREVLDGRGSKPGESIVMFAYGAGFCAHGVYGILEG